MYLGNYFGPRMCDLKSDIQPPKSFTNSKESLCSLIRLFKFLAHFLIGKLEAQLTTNLGQS